MEHGCSACCHDVEMLLTEADLERIRAEHPDRDFFFRAEDGFLQLRTRNGLPASGAWGGDGTGPPPGGESPRPCIFLEASGACGIHAIRPEGCRLYPAVWDEGLRAAALDADYCPHTDGFLLPKSTEDAVRRLADRLESERQKRLGP